MNDVRKVFVHKPGQFSILVRDDAKKAYVTRELRCNNDNCEKAVSFVWDVPSDKHGFMVERTDILACRPEEYGYVIHLHADSDIVGGSWQEARCTSHGGCATTGGNTLTLP